MSTVNLIEASPHRQQQIAVDGTYHRTLYTISNSLWFISILLQLAFEEVLLVAGYLLSAVNMDAGSMKERQLLLKQEVDLH